MNEDVVDTGSLTRKTALGAAWLVSWRLLTRMLGLLSTLVLAHILTPGDFGVVAMATIFSGIVDALSQLGLQDALVRRPENDRVLFDAAFTLQILRALLIGGALVAFTPVAVWWFVEPRLTPVLLVLAALAVLGGLENIGIVEFRRAMRYDKQFMLLSGPRLVQVATTVPLAFALQSYWALLAGMAAGRVARVAATYIAHAYRPSLSLSGWRQLAGFSFWTWAANVANMVWERCDSVLLGPVLGTAGLGVYLLAFQLAILPVSELIAPAADVLFTAFSAAQKRPAAIGATASAVAVALLLVVAPLTISISASSGYIVAGILGPKWIAAQPLIGILAWQCLFSPFSYVCTMLLAARGQVRLNFLGNLAAAAVKLLATLAVLQVTHRVDYVAATITLVVAAEAFIYMAMLRRAGATGFGQILGALTRISLAGSLAVGTLAASGFGWQMVRMQPLPALLHGGLLGCATTAAFAVFDLMLWQLAGRPSGPEQRLMELAGQFVSLPTLRRKLRL